MSVEDDGIKTCNRTQKKVEPLITVEELKERWLFGILPIIHNGEELSDDALQAFIDTAISSLEHDLDISITPTCVIEEKDYFANDYYEWGYFYLNNVPVREIKTMKVQYLTQLDGSGNLEPETVLEIPKEWWRIRHHDGQVRLVPNNKFPAQLQIGGGGSFFPELFRRHSTVPQLWHIEYEHGFAAGEIPVAVNMAIGLLASVFALNIAGDLVIGAGIAGTNLSLDGLSQGIQTTASAENHAYSAKVKEYHQFLFDKNVGIIPKLRAFYKGSTLNII